MNSKKKKLAIKHINDVVLKTVGWSRHEDYLLFNKNYAGITHVVVEDEDNRILYDFPLFTEIGGAIILPIDEEKKVGLIQINRVAVLRENTASKFPKMNLWSDYGRTSWEAPRGFRIEGENEFKTAIRELFEETGLISKDIIYLGDVVSNTTFCSTPIQIYAITVTSKEKSNIENHEEILDIRFFNRIELKNLLQSNKIVCSFTKSAIAHVIIEEII